MDAIILAGGLGTRLYPLTLSTPKALLPFLDRAIIEYQLDIAQEAGASNALAASGHLASMLHEYKPEADFPLSCVEEEIPLGTGGAIANAIRAYGLKGPLLAMNGDVLCDVAPRSLAACAIERKAACAILSAQVGDPEAYGTLYVSKDGWLVDFMEKQAAHEHGEKHQINGGIYYFSKEAVAQLAERAGAFSMETDFFPEMAMRRQVAVLKHYGYWRDIGSLESYFKAHFELLGYLLMMGTANFGGRRADYSLFKDFIYMNRDTTLSAGCDLYHRVVLMKGVHVGEKAYLRNCVVLPGASIGGGCRLETAIVGPGVNIPEGTLIDSRVITSEREEYFGG